VFEADCPTDPSFPGEYSVNWVNGADGDWHDLAYPTTFTALGADFNITTMGESYTYVSNNYILFGHVDVKMMIAPGQGIVSAFVMQSDDLDEIDWEFLGGQPTQGQSNYFTKGKNPVSTHLSYFSRIRFLMLFTVINFCWLSCHVSRVNDLSHLQYRLDKRPSPMVD
jgi:hypothetical protein